MSDILNNGDWIESNKNVLNNIEAMKDRMGISNDEFIKELDMNGLKGQTILEYLKQTEKYFCLSIQETYIICKILNCPIDQIILK